LGYGTKARRTGLGARPLFLPYGYICVVSRDGEKKWIADARKGEHRAKAEGRTLAEALRRLRELVEGSAIVACEENGRRADSTEPLQCASRVAR